MCVWPEVVDQDVSPLRQNLQRVAAARRLEVEDHALLVPVEAEVVGAGHRAVIRDQRRPFRSVDFARRWFYFDDARAGVGEQHRAVGACAKCVRSTITTPSSGRETFMCSTPHPPARTSLARAPEVQRRAQVGLTSHQTQTP